MRIVFKAPTVHDSSVPYLVGRDPYFGITL